MKILGRIFGMTMQGILILAFGISIGVATFMEDQWGTPAAKALVYNARWFEILMGLLMINMIVVIFTKRLYRKEKIVAFIFHVAFIVIIIGAGVTRFIGYEGIMPIREGESSNTMISEGAYVSVWVTDGEDKQEENKKVLFNRRSGAQYSESFGLNDGSEITVKATDFIPAAEYQLVQAENGYPVLTIVTTEGGQRITEYLTSSAPKNMGGLYFSFNNDAPESYIKVMETDSGLMMKSPIPGRFMRMADRSFGDVNAGEWQPFGMRQLYIINNINFVLSGYDKKAKLELTSSPDVRSNLADIVEFTISKGDQSQKFRVSGGKGIPQKENTVNFGNTSVSVAYGSLILQLPFRIHLNDFQLDRYPGSDSPSSYASEVVLMDESMGINEPHRIYMNNILEHRGFRFYQSSYYPDEGGTYLSVNHDYWGTFITYWGYFFLAVGLIAIFFSKNTRFHQLSKMIDNVHKQRIKAASIFLILLLSPLALSAHEGEELPAPSAEHAERFSSVLYQTADGRITPLNTVSSEILRKVVKKANYEGLTPDQVLLGMLSHPHRWQQEKMIRVNDENVAAMIGIEGKYASFLDFFTDAGEYKLKEQMDAAFAKKSSMRNTVDKELINVNERWNICYMTYMGSFLTVFPIPGHPDNKWVSPVDEIGMLSRMDSTLIKGIIPLYFATMEESMTSGDYTKSDELVASLVKYQEKYGAEVLPPASKVRMEILYNKINIFERLYPYYMLVGFVFLVIIYIRILSPKRELKWGLRIVQWLIVAGFIVHAVGLGMRWYISGHEPWSNGYESMLYIAWAGLLAGLIFRTKSPMTMAVTSILAGIILFVAHLSWMDPEITNLVPVLKSYWLTIHVATITASYGFMALGALLAFVNLVSMIMRRSGNRKRLDMTIKESTYVIEMTLTVGLVLLVIGNFLGGVWANESWGRYWGWDPKETWAMASIIFYSFVLHMRFIPGLKGIYSFNLAALITFSSIIMTYFGVNYYLSGLHSYAAGDPVPIPDFVPVTVGIIFVIAALAYVNERMGKKSRTKKPPQPPTNGKAKAVDAKLETVEG